MKLKFWRKKRKPDILTVTLDPFLFRPGDTLHMASVDKNGELLYDYTILAREYTKEQNEYIANNPTFWSIKDSETWKTGL